jgi:hypothetical protein
VVALDGGGVAQAGLDHVGINGALGQIVHLADLLASSSKTRMNSSPMILRLRSGSVTPASLVRNRSSASTRTKLMSHLLKGGLHLVALVFAHEAVIHEHAGELAAHGLGHKRRRHGGIHAAGGPAAPCRRPPFPGWRRWRSHSRPWSSRPAAPQTS